MRDLAVPWQALAKPDSWLAAAGRAAVRSGRPAAAAPLSLPTGGGGLAHELLVPLAHDCAAALPLLKLVAEMGPWSHVHLRAGLDAYLGRSSSPRPPLVVGASSTQQQDAESPPPGLPEPVSGVLSSGSLWWAPELLRSLWAAVFGNDADPRAGPPAAPPPAQLSAPPLSTPRVGHPAWLPEAAWHYGVAAEMGLLAG